MAALHVGRIVAIIFALTLSSACHAAMDCATASERKAAVEQLTRNVDWFLSIVEDVPTGVAQQFRAVDTSDERAFRNALSHPLWHASKIRDKAADVKDSLAITLVQTPDWRIKRAIMALGYAASLTEELSSYADKIPDAASLTCSSGCSTTRSWPLYCSGTPFAWWIIANDRSPHHSKPPAGTEWMAPAVADRNRRTCSLACGRLAAAGSERHGSQSVFLRPRHRKRIRGWTMPSLPNGAIGKTAGARL
jgi:hypothetical protein